IDAAGRAASVGAAWLSGESCAKLPAYSVGPTGATSAPSSSPGASGTGDSMRTGRSRGIGRSSPSPPSSGLGLACKPAWGNGLERRVGGESGSGSTSWLLAGSVPKPDHGAGWAALSREGRRSAAQAEGGLSLFLRLSLSFLLM